MISKNFYKKIILGLIVFTALFITPTQLTSVEKLLYPDNYPSIFELTQEDREWIEKKLNSMTLSEKCAQMIMPPVYRKDLDSGTIEYDRIASLVKENKIGGLIIYQGELLQQAKFINDMQRIADIPLLISADFERGLGTRIDDATEFPHAMALGSTHNPDYAYQMGTAIAVESRLIGVHLNFAPVADINNNPFNPVINVRSFSENRKEVAEFVKSFINGSKQAKLITTAKHFPGHGDTELDSHYDLPLIQGDENDLIAYELWPFIEAVNSGVQAVMTGHLEVPAFETNDGVPASLSRSITTDLLQSYLGFDGLIITDAMRMEGVTKNYTVEESVVMAVEAGNDIILMPPDELTALDAMIEAVNSGKLSLNRIDNSVRKILAAKRWLQIDSNRFSDISKLKNSIHIEDHIELSKRIAENSITLLKNDQNLIPLDFHNYQNISCVTVTDDYWTETAEFFQTILEKRLGKVKSVFLSGITKKYEYKSVLNELKNSDLIILPAYLESKTNKGPVKLFEEQTDFIDDILALKIPTILISFRNPYLLNLLPEAGTYLNAFSHSKPSQTAMMRAILGEINILGTLPVTLPESDFVWGDGLIIKKSLSTVLEYDSSLSIPLTGLDNEITSAIDKNIFPGAVVCIGREGKIIYKKASGNFGYGKNTFELQVDDIFNIGNLSRLISVYIPILRLIGDNQVNPETAVSFYLNKFNSGIDITLNDLLSGNYENNLFLPDLNSNWSKEELIASITDHSVGNKFSTGMTNKDLNVLILQAIIESNDPIRLDHFLNNRIFNQLGMNHTGFLFTGNEINIGVGSSKQEIPYVKTKNDVIREIMNGVSGIDGLYSSISDLAVFSQMLLQKGYYDDSQVIGANTLLEWIALNKLEPNETKSKTSFSPVIEYVNSDGIAFVDSRGCSMTIDFENELFIIILSNPETMNPANKRFTQFVKNFNEKVYDITLVRN